MVYSNFTATLRLSQITICFHLRDNGKPRSTSVSDHELAWDYRPGRIPPGDATTQRGHTKSDSRVDVKAGVSLSGKQQDVVCEAVNIGENPKISCTNEKSPRWRDPVQMTGLILTAQPLCHLPLQPLSQLPLQSDRRSSARYRRATRPCPWRSACTKHRGCRPSTPQRCCCPKGKTRRR